MVVKVDLLANFQVDHVYLEKANIVFKIADLLGTLQDVQIYHKWSRHKGLVDVLANFMIDYIEQGMLWIRKRGPNLWNLVQALEALKMYMPTGQASHG